MRGFAVAAGLSLSVAAPSALDRQQAHDYWFAGESNDEAFVTFIDAASIVSMAGNIRRAWVSKFYSNASPIAAGSKLLLLTEVNCGTQELHFLTKIMFASYDSRNPAVQVNRPEQWSYVIPDSNGKNDWEFICSSAAKKASHPLWFQLGQGVILNHEMVQATFDILDQVSNRELITSRDKQP